MMMFDQMKISYFLRKSFIERRKMSIKTDQDYFGEYFNLCEFFLQKRAILEKPIFIPSFALPKRGISCKMCQPSVTQPPLEAVFSSFWPVFLQKSPFFGLFSRIILYKRITYLYLL